MSENNPNTVVANPSAEAVQKEPVNQK